MHADGQDRDADAMRAGDAERAATVDALRDAVGAGRLTLDEFADRAGATFAATTLAELRALTSDLPAELPTTDLPGHSPDRDAPQRVVAVLGAAERRGRWQLGAEVSAVAVMGSVELDLYDAALTDEVTTIRAFALMGAVEILVPEGVPVEVEGTVVLGALEDRTTGASGQRAMLRVIGHGMFGAVEVGHREPDEEAMAGGEPTGQRTGVDPVPTGDTFTIMFTDIVESTVLAERLGDQRWFDVLRAHNALVREQVARHEGVEIKNQGDGFMVSFRSARRALLAATDIQRALEQHRRGNPEHEVHVRIGVHSGEVMTEDGDLHGRNVVLASRLAAMAGRDEVLASALTKQLADAGGDLCFGPGRPVAVKGLTGEWLVHAVDWS